jgi:hypothetical protein
VGFVVSGFCANADETEVITTAREILNRIKILSMYGNSEQSILTGTKDSRRNPMRIACKGGKLTVNI